MRVKELPDIDQYIDSKTTTNLGLIKDAANPMTRKTKQGAAILVVVLKNSYVNSKYIGFNKTDDIQVEGWQSEPQPSNTVGISSA